MKDFLHAVFSRGSQNQTSDPLVMVGGVDYTSQSLTTEVAHFSGGALLVQDIGVLATLTVSGNIRIFDSSGNSIIATNTTPALSAQGLNVRPIVPTASTASQTNISGTTGSVPVAATDGTRRMVLANNDSTAIMFLQYGVTAASNAYAVRIPSLGYWEMPLPIWQGSLSAIWDSANVGAGRFTILT